MSLDATMLAKAQVFGFDGSAQGSIDLPAAYAGLSTADARKAMLADLDAAGLLVDTKPHKLMVPRGDRTGSVIEPLLTDQWFVAMTKVGEGDATGKSITQKAIDAVESGEVRFVPENWVNTYNQWMNNIQDWCISRQLWWGHQIPAWYDEDGKAYVAARWKKCRPRHRARRCAATKTCSTPGSARRWYRFPAWAGRTRRRNSKPSCRRRCW